MTVTATANKFRYQGNGVTDTFAFPARVYAAADLVVEIITRATDALEETLTITTDYTVTIASNGTASVQVTNGAKIPDNTQDILIYRELANEQTLSLPTGTVFPAKSVETQLDRAVSQIQDLSEIVDRSVKIPVQSSLTSLEISSLPDAGKALKWNATEDGLINSTYDPDEQATLAAASAATATTQAGLANTARIAAEAAQTAAEAALSDFETKYLGAFASDPTLDNEGNALITGALYFNTATDDMKVYDGANWQNIADGTDAASITVDDTDFDVIAGTDVQTALDSIDDYLDAGDFGDVILNKATADTSAGLLVEASNGTDVVDFGAGNSANSTFYGNVSMNTTNKIVNMADPTSDQDAATKKYVDDNAGGGVIDNQVLTTSGTWTKPSGLSGTESVRIRLWGGGGGGRNNASNGGAGGGGGFLEYWTVASALGATEDYVIGAGGAVETAGGASTFGTTPFLFAGGGGASSGAGNGGGGGGSGSTVAAYTGGSTSATGGGSGAGTRGNGASGDAGGSNGGHPHGGVAGDLNGVFGGGYGSSSSGPRSAGDSVFGGGGGGMALNSTDTNLLTGGFSQYGGGGGGGHTLNGATVGGSSIWGGAGGAGHGGTAGTSRYGGNGGAAGSNGAVRGGGGGRQGEGGRGEIQVTVFEANTL